MPKAYIIHRRWISYQRYITRSEMGSPKRRAVLGQRQGTDVIVKAHFYQVDKSGLLLGGPGGIRSRLRARAGRVLT